MIPASADPQSPREPLYHHRVLIILAFAVVAALNIAVLFGLSQSHGAVGAQSGATATNPASKAIAGERPAGFPRPRQVIVLADKVGASASLRFAAESAGIGGDPVISYLEDSRSGPVLLLSGFPAGAAVRFLSIGAGRSCRNCATVSDWSESFPSGGEQFSPGTMICIAGDNGRVVLDTVQNQASGQIRVIVSWFPGLV
jgi:hypothetical protein